MASLGSLFLDISIWFSCTLLHPSFQCPIILEFHGCRADCPGMPWEMLLGGRKRKCTISFSEGTARIQKGRNHFPLLTHRKLIFFLDSQKYIEYFNWSGFPQLVTRYLLHHEGECKQPSVNSASQPAEDWTRLLFYLRSCLILISSYF